MKGNRILVLGRFLLFTFCVSALSAQQGTWLLKDKSSGEPIAFATILTGPDTGTISNSEGQFSIDLDKIGSARVRISCMGYETLELDRAQFIKAGNALLMEPAAIQLSEVRLSNRVLTAEEIIAMARQNLSANYVPEGTPFQLFYREAEKMQFDRLDLELEKASELNRKDLQQADARLRKLGDDIVKSNVRSFLDLSGAFKTTGDSLSILRVDRVTQLVDFNEDYSLDNIQERAQHIVLSHLDTTQTYKVKSGLFKVEDSISLGDEFNNAGPKDSMNLAELKSRATGMADLAGWKEESRLRKLLDPDLYRYTLLKSSFFDGNYVYAVRFEPDRRKAKYSGTLYVDANTFAVLKADYRFASGRTGEKVNLKLLLGIRYEENLSSGTVIFRRSETGKYMPYFVQRATGNYIYLHRSLTFIENSRDRKKVRFDFLLEGGERQTESALFRPLGADAAGQLSQTPQPERVYLVRLDHYEPTIWQDTEVIEPLEEMRNFHVRGD